tara:strand:+ start:3646 stop:5109 length:1464 start_codon:yes stop_codon:yes gene_type:complete
MERREVLQIKPTNQSDGVYSFNNGAPQIEFDIPRVPKFLLGKTLRINGTFNLGTGVSAGALAGDSISQLRPKNGFAAGDSASRKVRIDGRIGVQSCIDFCSIANLNGQSFEMIKNYNRLCASLQPKDYDIVDYFAGGTDIMLGACGKDLNTGRLCNKPFDFSIPIRAGIFEGDDTPINLQLVNGLHIVLQLASDAFATFNTAWDVGTAADDSGTLGSQATYQLSNITLTAEVVVPAAADMQAIVTNPSPEAFDYVAYSNYYNVLQTTDHTSVININTSRTIGFTMNMIPSNYVNNRYFNSAMTLPLVSQRSAAAVSAPSVFKNLAPLQAVTYTRGGVRIPLDFVIDPSTPQAENVTSGSLEFTTLNNIQKVYTRHHLLKNLQTELGLPSTFGSIAANNRISGRYQDQADLADNIPAFDLGVSFDHITENGIDFRGQPLGIRVQADFFDGNGATPKARAPATVTSLYLYVKHKNTIMFDSQGGVRVMS